MYHSYINKLNASIIHYGVLIIEKYLLKT